jgi:hypothetical protein
MLRFATAVVAVPALICFILFLRRWLSGELWASSGRNPLAFTVPIAGYFCCLLIAADARSTTVRTVGPMVLALALLHVVVMLRYLWTTRLASQASAGVMDRLAVLTSAGVMSAVALLTLSWRL